MLCGIGLSAGCAPKPPTRFEVIVRVESEPGQGLAGAELSLDGRALATTDAQGSVQLQLSGAAGDVHNVHVACPAGFRAPDRALPVVLRPLLGARKPEYRARCRPLLQSVVIAVRAQPGAHLPLRFLGREIARTDDNGVCHALLKLPAGETATFSLDTSAPEHARLLPKNPELKLSVPERDELVIFDQNFKREPERKRPRPKPEPVGPTRI